MKNIRILILLVLLGCKKDRPPIKPPDNTQSVLNDTSLNIIVSNEGTFGFGNAGITLYNPLQKTGIRDIYKSVNNQPLGDVLQSLYFLNQKIYCVVNNSNKIEVLEEKTFKKIGTINGLTSPRYFLPVTNSKAYVTDLYANGISIVDLTNNSKIGEIPCKGWTEQLILLNNKVYVTNYRSNYLYVINPSTDAVTDSILISKGALSLTTDNQNNIWVGCSSDEFNDIYGAIYVINAQTNTVIKSYVGTTFNFSVGSITYDKISGNIYYLNKGLNKIDASNPLLPGQSIAQFGNRIIYGFAPDLQGENIYLCDGKDYVQNGQVLIYNLARGALTDSFPTGTLPNHIYFRK